MFAKVQRHTTNKDRERLTVGSVLKGVLAFKELASGVVSLTGSAGVQRSLGAQNLVTAYCLHTHKNTHAINVDRTIIRMNEVIYFDNPGVTCKLTKSFLYFQFIQPWFSTAE